VRENSFPGDVEDQPVQILNATSDLFLVAARSMSDQLDMSLSLFP
jgi:hypothetical protein